MCAARIFIRSAGMSQRAASRLNSDHRVPINSLVRTNVSAINLIARRVIYMGTLVDFDGLQEAGSSLASTRA